MQADLLELVCGEWKEVAVCDADGIRCGRTISRVARAQLQLLCQGESFAKEEALFETTRTPRLDPVAGSATSTAIASIGTVTVGGGVQVFNILDVGIVLELVHLGGDGCGSTSCSVGRSQWPYPNLRKFYALFLAVPRTCRDFRAVFS